MTSNTNTNDRVAEIFKTAGRAFSELGELTMQLQNDSGGGGHKWTDEDINQLHSSLLRFSEDIHKISERLKITTVSQISTALQRKSFEKSSPTISMTGTSPSSGFEGLGSGTGSKTPPAAPVLATKSKPGVEVTLNMLNASDGDMDSQRMEFGSSGVTSP